MNGSSLPPGFRRLTNGGSGIYGRDLSPLDQEKMQRVAIYLYERHPIARFLTGVVTAYVFGEGVSIDHPDANASQVMKEFWTHPVNDLTTSLPEFYRAAFLLGELCLSMHVSPTGKCQIGYIDPSLITGVIVDPWNPRLPIGVEVGGVAKKSTYRVLYGVDDSFFSSETQTLRDTFTDGECFWLALNSVPGGIRGRSELLPVMDWLDGLEQYLIQEVDGASLKRMAFFDVTMTGATEEQLVARQNQLRREQMTPGQVRIHNENEIWTAVSPRLEAGEIETISRILRNYILSLFVPEHWFGGGGDVNRATAEAMTSHVEKMFVARQRFFGAFLKRILDYVCMKNGYTPEAKVSFPELSAQDMSRYTASFQQLITTLSYGIENSLLTEEFAQTLIANFSGLMGVEYDAQKELAKLLSEKTLKQEEDIFYEQKATEFQKDPNGEKSKETTTPVSGESH